MSSKFSLRKIAEDSKPLRLSEAMPEMMDAGNFYKLSSSRYAEADLTLVRSGDA